MSRIATATLAESVPQKVYICGKDEWLKMVIIQTGNGAGDVLLTTGSGRPTDGSSFTLPPNVPVELDLSPGDALSAMSTGGSRKISCWITPDVIAQLDEQIDAKLRRFLGAAVNKVAPPEEEAAKDEEEVDKDHRYEKNRVAAQEVFQKSRIGSFRRTPL